MFVFLGAIVYAEQYRAADAQPATGFEVIVVINNQRSLTCRVESSDLVFTVYKQVSEHVGTDPFRMSLWDGGTLRHPKAKISATKLKPRCWVTYRAHGPKASSQVPPILRRPFVPDGMRTILPSCFFRKM